jgi:uncharacterized membrane protein
MIEGVRVPGGHFPWEAIAKAILGVLWVSRQFKLVLDVLSFIVVANPVRGSTWKCRSSSFC